MKKISFMLLCVMFLVGCGTLFKKLDKPVDKMVSGYESFTKQTDELIKLATFVDSDVVKPLVNIYWDNSKDTYSKAFNSLNNDKQNQLIRMFKNYTKTKKDFEQYEINYAKFQKIAKISYESYQKAKSFSEKASNFVTDIINVSKTAIKLRFKK